MTAELIESPEQAVAIDSEGFAYCPESGEVLGLADLPDDFRVESREAAEFVLRLRAESDGRALALKLRRAALVENLDRQIAAENRRQAYLQFRFGSGLVDFARSLLRGKSKTALFDHGSVSFRATPGGAEVTDQHEAVDYVETYRPDLVTVKKSVNVAAVRAAREAAEAATGEPEGRLVFLVETGPGESVTVSTGVDARGRK